MSALESVKNPVGRLQSFLTECWAEVKKVHWPTRAETRAATIAVIIGVAIVSVYLGAVDFLLSMLVRRVLG
jgi:preprotein translocase subunit SecE